MTPMPYGTSSPMVVIAVLTAAAVLAALVDSVTWRIGVLGSLLIFAVYLIALGAIIVRWRRHDRRRFEIYRGTLALDAITRRSGYGDRMKLSDFDSMSSVDVAAFADQLSAKAEQMALAEVCATFADWGIAFSKVVLGRSYDVTSDSYFWKVELVYLADGDGPIFEDHEAIAEINREAGARFTLAVQPIVRNIRDEDMDDIHLTMEDGQAKLSAVPVYRD